MTFAPAVEKCLEVGGGTVVVVDARAGKRTVSIPPVRPAPGAARVCPWPTRGFSPGARSLAPARCVRDRGLLQPASEEGESLPCRACGGTRLRPEALAVRIQDRNIGDIARLPIREARAWVQSLGPMREEVSQRILPELMNRLTLLDGLGCGLPDPGPGHEHPGHRRSPADPDHRGAGLQLAGRLLCSG